MATSRILTADQVYGSAFAAADDLEAELEHSLGPTDQEQLFDIVAGLGLPAGSVALDVGAREGYHTIELARRFGFRAHGIEPVRLHLDGAARALAGTDPDVAALVAITEGVAEHLPADDAGVDLVWCRDVLVHIQDLERVFGEFHRVLRPGGHALIYQMFATDWLTPDEADRLWPPIGVHATSTDPARFDAAIAAAGLTVRQCVELHGTWREAAEENGSRTTSRQLLWASRMLRNRAHYESRHGTATYEAVLGNCLWGVYQMIGKLSPRIYLLQR